MKRVISFLLIFVFIFLCFCSCSNEIKESVNLNLEFLKDKTITNIDNNDKYILIRSIPFTEEESPETKEIIAYYYVWDIEKNKLKSSLEQKENFDSDNYISEVEINKDNQITLYTYDNPEQTKFYNLLFKETGALNESYITKQEKRDVVIKSNKLIDYDRFSLYGNFATDNNLISKQAGVFLDDPDNVYIFDYDKTQEIINANGKLVLTSTHEENATLITYFLTDYERLSKREIKVEYSKYISPCLSSMSDKYTVICVCDENNKSAIISVINNLSGTVSNENIKKIPTTEIDSEISSIIKEIENKYGVETEIAKEYDENSTINQYFYDNDYTKAQILLAMYDFEKSLSTFPDEFYNEIISSKTGFDKLKFYFVGSFDAEKNNILAYCSNMNDELFIVYSVNNFAYSTFCHELMHAMEFRINDNVLNFDDEWVKLNPKEFEYINFDIESNPFYENEENQKYFARELGTNNSLEDRATVFEEICYSDFYNEKSPWWAEFEPLTKKAVYLKTLITKSFPSLSNIWEKYNNIL